MIRESRVTGVRAFWRLWSGQSIAALGSGLTGFALGVWAFERTGLATQYALVATCSVMPGLLLAPLAGNLIDRWTLRGAMLVGHAGALLGAALAGLLAWSGALEVWHLYVITAATSVATSLQWPSFTAATSLLVPPERLGHASGMVQLGESTAQLLSPVAGGLLYAAVGLEAVLVIEAVALTSALALCVTCAIPAIAAPSGERTPPAGILAGVSYVIQRPGLVGLLALSCILSAAIGFLEVLSAPVVLSVASSSVLGMVRSVAGAGMVAGSLAVATWGTPSNRVRGLLTFQMLAGAFVIAMGLARRPWLMALAGFGGLCCIPVANGCAQILWQTKVSPSMQGRVFALRRLATLTRALGFLAAGSLTDLLFDPITRAASPRSTLAAFIGHGPGRGGALALVLIGGFTIVGTALARLYRPLRQLQTMLPDVVLYPTDRSLPEANTDDP